MNTIQNADLIFEFEDSDHKAVKEITKWLFDNNIQHKIREHVHALSFCPMLYIHLENIEDAFAFKLRWI